MQYRNGRGIIGTIKVISCPSLSITFIPAEIYVLNTWEFFGVWLTQSPHLGERKLETSVFIDDSFSFEKLKA